MIDQIKNNKKYFLFLSCLSILSIVILIYGTSTYKAGVSTDAAKYLSYAENFAAGNGMVDYNKGIIAQWPPLYPLILACFSLITGLPVLDVGWLLNIISYGLLIWSGGYLFFRVFRNNRVFAVFATLILFTLPQLARIFANVASDPLSILMLIIFFIEAINYLETGKNRSLITMIILSIAATFIRYSALSMVATLSAVMLVRNISNLRRAFIRSALVGGISGLPIVLWAIFHNLPINGSLFGRHMRAEPAQNFIMSLNKFAEWFIPHRVQDIIPGWIWVLSLSIGLLLAYLLTKQKDRLIGLLNPSIFPALFFSFIYFLMLVFYTSYLEHRLTGNDRIHLVMLPSLIILLLSSVEKSIWEPFIKDKAIWFQIGFGIIAGSLLVFPSYNLQKYIRVSHFEGDISAYNIFNKRWLRESELVGELLELEIEDSQQIFSNNEGTVWFYLHRNIESLPHYPTEERNPSKVLEIKQIPSGSYIIWFNHPELSYKGFVPTPEELSTQLTLEELYALDIGSIYLVSGGNLAD
ncbi:MAG: hypothetical protein JEZ06_01070 [Anaerolineaceae bacterium]|nr:hypothetical protein [Anaerolineaceae bacterium]